MSNLVSRLSKGDHRVIVGGTQPSLDNLKTRIEQLGYVFIKFTETQGGTDLGVRLDKDAVDISLADFENGTGKVHLEGHLILDYEKVRCIADIDLASLSGQGHLVKI